MITNIKTNNLISGFNRRDMDCWDKIFKSLYPKLCYFTENILNNQQVSEDIVQDVFLKLWNSDNQFESFDKLTSFLYISIKNRALNHIKSNKIISNSEDLVNDVKDSNAKIIENISKSEIISILHLAIKKLPNECSKVMQLVVQGYTCVEIAEQLSLADSSVRAQKARGIKLLKNKLPREIYIFIILYLVV